jgi:hypothetical protein
MRQLQKTIGQRRFAVVDMGDNAKIPDIFHNNLKAGFIRIRGDFQTDSHRPVLPIILIKRLKSIIIFIIGIQSVDSAVGKAVYHRYI